MKLEHEREHEHEHEHLDRRFKKNQPAVIAVFKDHSHLEKTLDELKNKKFSSEDISILMAKREDLKDIGYDHNARIGATTGMFTGITAGGILGWLASLNIFAVPGVGPFIVAGPFVAAIAGAALGGTVGSIGGALIGYGITEYEARKLENFVKDKGVIVSVHVDDPREQLVAKNILVTNGAIKIHNPMEKKTKKPSSKKYLRPKLREA